MSEKLSTVDDFRRAIDLVKIKENVKLFSDDQLSQINQFQEQVRKNGLLMQQAIANISKQWEGIAEKLRKSFEIYGQSLGDIKYFRPPGVLPHSQYLPTGRQAT